MTDQPTEMRRAYEDACKVIEQMPMPILWTFFCAGVAFGAMVASENIGAGLQAALQMAKENKKP